MSCHRNPPALALVLRELVKLHKSLEDNVRSVVPISDAGFAVAALTGISEALIDLIAM